MRKEVPLVIICPKCGDSFDQNLRMISRGDSRTCPHCSGEVEFTGSLLWRIIKAIEPRKGE